MSQSKEYFAYITRKLYVYILLRLLKELKIPLFVLCSLAQHMIPQLDREIFYIYIHFINIQVVVYLKA